MQTLAFLRHAKSEGVHAGGGDFDRRLSGRGLKAAALMGEHLRERGVLPGHILCSPAGRARKTLECMGEGFADCPGSDFFDDLYLATPETLLSRIADVGEEVASLLVIGHNPGIEEVAVALARRGAGSPGALTGLAGGFVTAALAVFEIDGESFAGIEYESARLVHFAAPRSLA